MTTRAMREGDTFKDAFKSVKGTVPAQEQVSDALNTVQAVEKIEEGHRQIEAARKVELTYLQEAINRAQAGKDLLDRDAEALSRHGVEMDAEFKNLRGNLSIILSALEMAQEALDNLLSNNEQRRGRHAR